MTDYRDHFATRPDIPTYRDRSSTGFVGPIIALAIVAVLIAGVFFLSSGTQETGVSGDPAAPAAMDTAPAPAAPTTMDTAPAEPAATEPAAQ